MGKIQLTVYQRPPGELPWSGQPGSLPEAKGQQALHHQASTVAAEFCHFLSGIAFGGMVDKDHTVVQGVFLFPGEELSIGAVIAGEAFQGPIFILGAEDPTGNGDAFRAGESDHSDTAAAAGGDSGDGILLPRKRTTHKKPPYGQAAAHPPRRSAAKGCAGAWVVPGVGSCNRRKVVTPLVRLRGVVLCFGRNAV